VLLLTFVRSTIGKKVLMAATGLILFGFVIGHLLGNLQIFLGPTKLDEYSHFLKSNPAMLWTARGVLLAAVAVHIVLSIQLAALNASARPVGYARKENAASTYSSRTMMWSGPLVALFVVYHLLHFTFGTVHPDGRGFDVTRVHHNVVTGLADPLTGAIYVAALLLLGMHLSHGVWSMFQTTGLNHPKYDVLLRRGALLFGAAIFLGYAAIPAAILMKLVK
jgi:succinate dehydrogenase / fumarate reductase cytochrome b subunit